MKKAFLIAVPIIAAFGIVAFFVLKPRSYVPPNKIICIDAGHGGEDAGAVLDKRYEKDDNLRIALKIADELKALGFEPFLTRDDDSFVELHTRCDLCNEKNCSYFVSLHRNSADIDASGTEVWISAAMPEPDKALAAQILKNLEKVGISKNRGLKWGTNVSALGEYTVNKYTDCPSCIVELGFISSAEDNALFDENLDKYAKAIAEAIAVQYGL